MNTFSVKRGLQILLPLSSATKINFENDARLNGKKVKAIIARTFDTTGGAAITAAVKRLVYLTIKPAKGELTVERMPIYLLDPKDNSTGAIFTFDLAIEISWQDSYIEWTPAAVVAEKLEFFVVFED